MIGPDWGGPADYIDPSCGILVSPVPRATFASRLADAILRLASDRARSAEMGASGRRKAQVHYDWERKVDFMQQVYLYAAGSRDLPSSDEPYPFNARAASIAK